MTVYSSTSKALNERETLKLHLTAGRMELCTGPGYIGYYVICPVCGERIIPSASADLHEAILTRGKLAGAMEPEKALKLISHRCNCVLRHHVCPDGQYHTSGTGGDEVLESCVKQIVVYEGLSDVITWLWRMEEYFPIAAKEARLRVIGIYS